MNDDLHCHGTETGQTMAEYAVMLGVLVAAAVAMIAVLEPALEAAILAAADRI